MAAISRKPQKRVEKGREHVLRELHSGGPRTPREIASSLARLRIHYTPEMVKDRLRELRDDGLVRLGPADAIGLVDAQQKRNGRPVHYATLSERWGLGVGVEVGRSLLRAGVVNPGGDLLARDARRRSSTRIDPTLREVASLVNALLDQLTDEQRSNVIGITVAVSAPIERHHQAVVGGLLPDWEMEPLDTRIGDLLETSLPVGIVNDANARAIGEGRFGLARTVHSAFVLRISGGIGGALLRRGQVLDGYWGLAGEIGHVGVSLKALTQPRTELKLPLLSPDARCSCHDRGGQHLEAYASTTVIARRVAVARNRRVTFDTVASEWRTRGDARRAVEDAARLLGLAAATVVTLCDPQVIIVRGRFAICGDDAAEPMRQVLAATRPFRHERAKVLVAAPGQRDIGVDQEFDWLGVRGAARIAVERNTSVDNPPRSRS